MERVFKPRIEQQTQKVIVGIDFGTSFTKVYFDQGGEIKQPLKFNVGGKQSFFLPTILFYNPGENKLYIHKKDNCLVLRYFKYSMINDNLITSNKLKTNNKNLEVRPEFLCSIFFLAFLIKYIKSQITGIIKTTDIEYTINMGCPIENYADKNKDAYTKALSVAYQLSEIVSDGMAIEDLMIFYNSNHLNHFSFLQTIPELYAEALWFIEQPSTGEGIYTILDIGGGTVDFASIYVTRTDEGEKKTTIYSQRVMPLGIEILLKKMYPEESLKEREKCINHLKKSRVIVPDGWEPKHNNNRKLKIVREFDNGFAMGIAEVKERIQWIMDKQNTERKYIPYYSFGGGADFNWYHSIIDSLASRFLPANIPPFKRQKVILNNIPDNRLIIAEQLTRSNFPNIEGFPWQFIREHIFSGIERDEPFNKDIAPGSDAWPEMEARHKERFPD